MAFDIKKMAIALGCAGVVAIVYGGINSGSDTNEYRPITSLADLDQPVGQTEDLTLTESVTIENAQRLPSDDIGLSLESPDPILSPVPPVPQQMEMAEAEDDFLEIEFSDEPMSTDSESTLDETSIVEEPVVDDDNSFLSFAEEPSLDVSESIPETPASDEATVDASMQATAPVEPEKNKVRSSKRVGPNWKSNPFMSTKSPATPLDSKSKFSVQPASMATTAQAVRSLNEIEGIPTQATIPTTPEPHVHTSASVLNSGAPITQIAPVAMALSDATAQKAVHHIEYGKSLIRRGANFAARSEFFAALRVIAEANDNMTNGNEFSMALSKAIRAMREAEDFAVQDAQSFAVVNVPSTIESHKTKLLTPVEARRISPRSAMQQYYNYAAQQLDFAGGRNVVTAEALHCLGKLHSVISSQQPSNANTLDTSQAIVFHRSSLLSNPNNPASANELGVLLAKSGSLEEATHLFKQSLISQPTAQGWSNLAKTHQRMGEQQLAHLAQSEIAISAQNTSIATAGIQWIDTPQFNAMAPTEFEPRIAQKTPAVIQPTTETKKPEADEEPKASIAQRIKKWF